MKKRRLKKQVGFLQRLIRARSANPFLPEASPPDVPIEAEVAARIHEELHQLGLPATFYGVSPSVPMSSVES